jgi:hypothetical protein
VRVNVEVHHASLFRKQHASRRIGGEGTSERGVNG